ncbi:MAG: CopD family protein [Dehalococcoidia bacterium]|nr:CopD family protein [Dehalococcoidia bacterium]MDW8120220.1 CopD family protein [Chloroflexota bacterium]
MEIVLGLLHLLGTAVWFGGVLFLGLVLVPVSRAFGETGQNLVRSVGRRFVWIVWPAIGVAVASGVEFGIRYGYWEALFRGNWGAYPLGGVFVLKVVLVGLALVLEGLHDWVIPALATRRERSASATTPPHPALLAQATALRRMSSRVAMLNGGVVLAVVVLGVWLSRG